MFPANARCSVEVRGGMTIVAIGGRLDAHVAPGIRDELSSVGEEPEEIVFDLAKLEWIDSTGIGVLLSIYRRCRRAGGGVKVAGLARQPREIFRLLRLDAVMELVDSVEAAASPAAGY